MRALRAKFNRLPPFQQLVALCVLVIWPLMVVIALIAK